MQLSGTTPIGISRANKLTVSSMSRQKSRLYIPKSFNQFQPLDSADLARTADDDRLPFNVFHQVRDDLILDAQLFQAVLTVL
jgi:hypothetical protein